MKENHLYVYIPRPNTVQRHGVYAPSNAPFEKVQHYVKRTAEYYNIDELDVDHKKIVRYLETWFRGRSRAISVLTEPIPDTASERILEFRNMSDCITLPSFEELKKYNIAEACYLSVDGGKDKKVDGPDYSPVNWKQDKTPQFRFKGIRHYFIVLKSGVVPAKYCTIGNDFAEESLSDKVASNIENNKVYHASPLKLDVLNGKASKTKDAESSVFVSPFKHFASMFILDFQGIVDTIEEQIGKKHIKIDNFGFMEWNETPRSTTSIPSKVHVLVRTPENFKPFKGKATGYLYTIDFNKYKDKADMWSHAQGSSVEMIIHGDVHYEKCEQITLEYEIMKDTKQHNDAIEEFSQESLNEDDTIRKSKLYFSTIDGKLPLDDNGNGLFCKNLDDARIDAAMITYYRRMHRNCCCEGYVPGMKHVLLVHTDESHKEEQVFDVKGSVYSVTFKEPVEMRFYAHWGYGKCKLPKCYLVKKEELKDYKIEKEEDVNLKATCRYVEEFKAEEDLDVTAELLQEFNAGIEEFNRWVRDLDLYSIKKDLNDPQVDMVFSQIAQENVIIDTIKNIFRKIGEFIAWFFRKLKELWNFFFGRTQRAMRALKAASEQIIRHKNSNGFFNDGAFEACKVPDGLVTAIGLNNFIVSGFSPDVYNNIFKEILNMWGDDPQKLYEEVFVKLRQNQSGHNWKMSLMLFTVKKGNRDIDSTQLLREMYPSRGTMRESAYDRNSVLDLLKGTMDAISAYEINSKLISTKGNISYTAASRIIQYQDRTDISEQEAIKLAKDIQELANWLQLMFKGYQRSFEFILSQMGIVVNVYRNFMR